MKLKAKRMARKSTGQSLLADTMKPTRGEKLLGIAGKLSTNYSKFQPSRLAKQVESKTKKEERARK